MGVTGDFLFAFLAEERPSHLKWRLQSNPIITNIIYCHRHCKSYM